MELFLNEKYSESINKFDELLNNTSNDNKLEKCIILCNKAFALLKLELLRKCIKCCEDSILLNVNYIQAFYIKAEALIKSDKNINAIECLKEALKHITIISDCKTINDIKVLLNSLTVNNNNSNNNNTNKKLSDNTTSKISKSQLNNNNNNNNNNNTGTLSRNKLSQIHTQLLNQILGSSTAPILDQVRSNLSHASGDVIVDDLIALGYLQVNTGNLSTAIEIFEILLSYRSDLPAAHIALGSAYALMRKYDEAIKSFTKCIECNSNITDAWKRRGQVKTAKGLLFDAIYDINKAIELSPNEPDIYMQRGITYHSLKNYKAALSDFKNVLSMDNITYTKHCTLYNYLGMCQAQVGDLEDSINSYLHCMSLDVGFKEAYINYAQMCKENGNYKDADIGFLIAIKIIQANIPPAKEAINSPTMGLPPAAAICKNMCNLLLNRSSMHYGLGNILKAFEDYELFDKTVIDFNKLVLHLQKLMTDDSRNDYTITEAIQVKASIAMCYFGWGCYSKAIQCYNNILSIDPNHVCWYMKQIMLHIWRFLDEPFDNFNLDTEILPILKDAYTKKMSYKYFTVLLNLLKNNSGSANNKSTSCNFICQTGWNGTNNNIIHTGYKKQEKLNQIQDHELYELISSLMIDENFNKLNNNSNNNNNNLPPNIGYNPPMNKNNEYIPDVYSSIDEIRKVDNYYIKPQIITSNTLSSSFNLNNMIPLPSFPMDNIDTIPSNKLLLSLLHCVIRYGEWIQLNSKGFLPNARQHVQFGCSTVEMSRTIRKHVISKFKLKNFCNSPLFQSDISRIVDGSGYYVSDSRSSMDNSLHESLTNKLIFHQSKILKSNNNNNNNNKLKDTEKEKENNVEIKKDKNIPVHVFNWRDLMDISVRWRQISEPNDVVFWIDRYPNQAVVEGFGLETPIVSGQLNTVRYYCYYRAGVQMLLTMLSDGYFYNAANDKVILSKQKLKQLQNVANTSIALNSKNSYSKPFISTTLDTTNFPEFLSGSTENINFSTELDEIYKIINEDFYVITPCYSTHSNIIENNNENNNNTTEKVIEDRNKRDKTEGTRLTLVRHHPEGYAFTIRTACTPPRLVYFDKELELCFDELYEYIAAVWIRKRINNINHQNVGDDENNDNNNNDNNNNNKEIDCNNDNIKNILQQYNIDNISLNLLSLSLSELVTKVHRKAFELFFLWVNFAPLSRGSAACGYTLLLSIILSINYKFKYPLPRNIQLDWESIFTPHCEDFINRVINYMPIIPLDDKYEESSIENAFVDYVPVEHICSTYRSMIRILNIPKYPMNYQYGDVSTLIPGSVLYNRYHGIEISTPTIINNTFSRK